MATAEPPEAPAVPSDYVRVKRKMTTIFLYAELGVDTVHDLRVRVRSPRARLAGRKRLCRSTSDAQPFARSRPPVQAKVNLITKVPTTDIKFYIDKDGEVCSRAAPVLRGHSHTRAHASHATSVLPLSL